MGSSGRVHAPHPQHAHTHSQASASAHLPSAYWPGVLGLPGSHPKMVRRGNPSSPLPNTPPHQPLGLPTGDPVSLSRPRMGCSKIAAEGTPHTQRRAQQVFQVCPSDTTAEKEIPGCNDCLQARHLTWVAPQHLSGTPISTSHHLRSKYIPPPSEQKLPMSGTVPHTAPEVLPHCPHSRGTVWRTRQVLGSSFSTA